MLKVSALAQKGYIAMICISIPSREDSYLQRCLGSIRKSEPGWHRGTYALAHIGDNGISEGVRKQYPWADFVPVPGGEDFVFSRAHNLCVARMPQEADLLLLNDDTEVVTPDFLTVLDVLLRAPSTDEYGLISLRVIGGVGNEEQAQTLRSDEVRLTQRAACFVAVLIRRECWDEVGLMDERFIGYGEDDCDYTYRAHLAGWKVGITGAVSVKHGMDGNPHSSSYNKDGRENKQTRTRWERQSALNVRLFVEKWGSFSWELVK